jgi:hypothetical protein
VSAPTLPCGCPTDEMLGISWFAVGQTIEVTFSCDRCLRQFRIQSAQPVRGTEETAAAYVAVQLLEIPR